LRATRYVLGIRECPPIRILIVLDERQCGTRGSRLRLVL